MCIEAVTVGRSGSYSGRVGKPQVGITHTHIRTHTHRRSVGETRPDLSKVGNRVCTTMPLLPSVTHRRSRR